MNLREALQQWDKLDWCDDALSAQAEVELVAAVRPIVEMQPGVVERVAQAIYGTADHTQYCQIVDAELDAALADARVDYDEPPPKVRRCRGECRHELAREVLHALVEGE